MKRIINILPFAVLAIIGFSGCKKDTTDPPADTPAPTTGSLTVSINHTVNGQPLVLSTQSYVNAAGDTFTVDVLNYYLTNIVLHKSDGSTYTEPESYRLVRASQSASQTFTITGVPIGEYSSITYTIGVDSARNVSGAQTGALDPANGMFWTWNTGYIQAKLEGSSPSSPGSGHIIAFHIGGYSGVNHGIRTNELLFDPARASVTASTTPVVYLDADVAEWFKTPNQISFATIYSNTAVNPTNKMIADNYYRDFFSVNHIQN